ncbi:MAG TPA: phosphatidylserine decarboxylase family protein [Candidatus Kryptonia bacterium]
MFPRLARYGSDVIAVVVIVSVALVVGSFLTEGPVVRIILDFIALIATAFTLYFFRDPDRTPASEREDAVISPADGKIVFVGDVREDEYLKSNARMISIFMSPLNVHVNRIPMKGTVEFLKYVKGDYLVAFDEKSSSRNERMLIGIEDKGQRLLFKQIAGFVARRIVCELTNGQVVNAGDRFGMIKFGSRVDVLLPMNSEVTVKMNDKTFSGKTVLGFLRNE